MKNILAFIIIIALGWGLTYLGPWYLVAVAGFIAGLLIANQWRAFLIGFIAGLALWATQLFLIEQSSNSDLPERMAQLIGVGSGMTLLWASATIGGLITAFGAAAGGALTQKKKRKRRY